jgi:hypothetical protein
VPVGYRNATSNFEVVFMSELMNDFEYPDDFDEEVWDEKKWEEFMQESDRKADEYLKKFEEERKKGDSVPHLPEPKKDSHFDDEIDEESELEFSDLEPEAWESPRMYWEDGDFEQIPAYQIAYDFAIAAYNFVELFYPERADVPEIKQLLENCFIIPVKIAGGHGMGYEKDTLEGNIANCKRGLVAANNCVNALENLKAKTKTTPELLRIHVSAVKTREVVKEWIEELRGRIWWR